MSDAAFRLEVKVINEKEVLAGVSKKYGVLEEFVSANSIRLNAAIFKNNLINAIVEQKYVGLWSPYKKYAKPKGRFKWKHWGEEKAGRGLDSRFWVASKGLLKHIEKVKVTRVRGTTYQVAFLEGIVPSSTYGAPGGKNKMAGMLRNEELRPLFRLVFEDTYMEMSRKFKDFQRRVASV